MSSFSTEVQSKSIPKQKYPLLCHIYAGSSAQGSYRTVSLFLWSSPAWLHRCHPLPRSQAQSLRSSRSCHSQTVCSMASGLCE
uniref:Uncharacterized protein n=1 Tax=Anguilla anguilla TaxID=7936 RepID=A0A0E9XTD8_ANGAN